MSLINQVLKDLDQQRGPAEANHVAALQGVGLVHGYSALWPRIGMVFASLIALALIVVFAYQFVTTDENTAAEPAVRTIQPAEVPVESVPEETILPAGTESEPVSPLEPEQESAAIEDSGTPLTAPVEPEADVVTRPGVVDTPHRATDADTATAPPEPVQIKRMNSRQKAEQLYLEAQQVLDNGETVRAEDVLLNALDVYPYHVDARVELSLLLVSQQREAAAESIITDGLSLNPESAPLQQLYAQLLASRGELQAAIRVLTDSENGKYTDADSLGLRAAIHSRLQDYAQSASDYRKALSQNSKRADWWTGLGIALEHLGRASVAMEAYRHALALPMQNTLKVFAEQRLQLLEQASTERDG